MKKLLFRLSVYLFVLIPVTTTLFSQQLFLENGTPSHPSVKGYSSSTRAVIDLSGEWNYSLDNGITWKPVRIPAAADYEGRIIYRRKFSADESFISQYTFSVVSYGMNYQSEVFINETFVGKHEGGYTSFDFPIPENIIQIGSENVIRVVVDNTLNYRTTFPPRPQVSGWKNYNGILRDFFIAASPKVWMNDVSASVEAIEPKAVRLSLRANVSSKEIQSMPHLAAKAFQVSADVVESSTGTVIGKPVSVPVSPVSNNEVEVQLSVTIPNAKLWSPEAPELYTVKFSLQAIEGKKDSLIDEQSVTTGIRTITKDKHLLLFNGASMVLRGIVWIEDSELHGSAMTYEEMERDVALMKNLGANVVRVGFHPPHPFFIQLCDRYGLLVMQEIPNFEIPGKIIEDEQYGAIVGEYLKSMIERDRENPSVLAWGLGEGSGYGTDISNNVITRLHRIAKSLDDRLTYFVVRNAEEEITSAVDIAAISFPAVDLKTFRTRVTAFKEANPKKPVIIAGYGRTAERGNRNGYSDPNSQEGQARYIQQRYTLMKDLGLTGSLIFSFNDYRSDRPILGVKPTDPELHTSGITELGRQKKSGYDIVHSMYHGQKISALPIGSYVPNSPYAYVVIGMVLLVIAAWLINGNRRYRESTRRAIFNSYNFFADIRDQYTLPLFHTTITAMIIAVTFSVIFSSVMHHFRSSIVLDYFLSYLFSDDIKMVIIRMCWDPLLSVGYATGMMVIWFFLLTLFIQLLALMARVKIRLFHSYSIAVWTALPWAFFIPVGMILYRVLESEPYVPWVMGLFAFMSVWVYIRTLKGISVIYHVYTPKMYMIGLMAVLIVGGAAYAYVDYAYSFTIYAEFFATRILPIVQ